MLAAAAGRPLDSCARLDARSLPRSSMPPPPRRPPARGALELAPRDRAQRARGARDDPPVRELLKSFSGQLMATTAAAVIACAAGASYVYEQPKPGYIAGWVEPDSPTGSGTNYKTLAEAMVKCDEYASSFGECKVSGGNAGTP